jgi:hypothetical protein
MFNKAEEALTGMAGALVKSAAGDALANWSEDKRKEYVALFQQRSESARYILNRTAGSIIDAAQKRYFISPPKAESLKGKLNETGTSYHRNTTDRSTEELQAIANERANEIIKSLPSVIQTFTILQPDIAVKMTERDLLESQLKKLGEQFNELPTGISMRSMDPKMTIGEFLDYIDNVAKQRDKLINQMNRIAEKGNALTREVDKALYSGVPELTKAVTEVVTKHIDKINGFAATTRRIEERVLYGDSTAALEILKTFEKDELEVGFEVKAQFQLALDTLGLTKARKKAAKKRIAK